MGSGTWLKRWAAAFWSCLTCAFLQNRPKWLNSKPFTNLLGFNSTKKGRYREILFDEENIKPETLSLSNRRSEKSHIAFFSFSDRFLGLFSTRFCENFSNGLSLLLHTPDDPLTLRLRLEQLVRLSPDIECIQSQHHSTLAALQENPPQGRVKDCFWRERIRNK